MNESEPNKRDGLKEKIDTILWHLSIITTGQPDDEWIGDCVKVANEDITELFDTYTQAECEKVKKEAYDSMYEEARIMGKSVDEICTILCGLDLERITDIKVTMSNLGKLYKKLEEDMHDATQKAINKSFDDVLKRANINQLKDSKEIE